MPCKLATLFSGKPSGTNRCSVHICLSKTSQIIFDLHPGFSHMEDEKGNKLHLFKKYFKIFFFYYTSHHWSLLLFILIAFCVTKAFAKKN